MILILGIGYILIGLFLFMLHDIYFISRKKSEQKQKVWVAIVFDLALKELEYKDKIEIQLELQEGLKNITILKDEENEDSIIIEGVKYEE